MASLFGRIRLRHGANGGTLQRDQHVSADFLRLAFSLAIAEFGLDPLQ
jgi:hypothetical protein